MSRDATDDIPRVFAEPPRDDHQSPSPFEQESREPKLFGARESPLRKDTLSTLSCPYCVDYEKESQLTSRTWNCAASGTRVAFGGTV